MSLPIDDLKYWKEEFISYMCSKYDVDREWASEECESYVEINTIDDIYSFDEAVMECVEGWN